MKKSVKLKKSLVANEIGFKQLFADYENEKWEVIQSDPKYSKLINEQRSLKEKLSYLKLREIQSYCNQHIGSDAEPYEVLKVISDKTVEIRAMSTKQIKFPKDFYPGGFVGHFADNYSQKYEYTSNPDAKVERVRWSEANRQWQQGKYGRFTMSESPCKFYDYNF